MTTYPRFGLSCLAVLLIGLVSPVVGQVVPAPGGPAPGTIRLRSANIDTRTVLNLAQAVPASYDLDRVYVIQIDGPMTPQKRGALRDAGVRLGDYLPDHAYLARMGNASPEQVAGVSAVRWVGEYQDAWKTDPQIGRRPIPFATPERALLHETGKVQLVVTLFEGRELEPAMERISMTGAEIIGGTMVGRQGTIDLIIEADRVQDLARFASVQYVEEAPELVMRNDTNEWILQSNVSGQTPVWDQGIHGEGQIGGVIDGPPRESHCSFDDSMAPGPDHRKIFYYAGSIGSDSHGTHVGGTMAGDQSPYGEASFRDGMAFGARFTFIPVSPIYSSPSTFILRLQDAHDPYGTGEGARVHSNSWGDDATTAYTTWCRHIDLFSRENEDDLVCFAVTNMSSLKTPENAKNVLAVGASRDTPSQNSHCSGGVGPTSDGRRKPEIYAPGCSTQSSDSGTTCSWTGMTGTSMACPAIAGAALLVRQYYLDGFYPSGVAVPGDSFVPSGALVKATLINAAVDMTGVSGYPSNLEGWGRLLLDNSLYFSTTPPGSGRGRRRTIMQPENISGGARGAGGGDTRKLFVDDLRNGDGLTTAETVVYSFDVLDNSVPLRVTLVWTDVPATVGAGFAPINDLDLEVVAPGGETYLGNDFNTSTGESTTGGSRDDRNNVEQVHRLVPALGSYMVTVRARAVNQETQGYALVITGAMVVAPPDCNGNSIPDDQDIAEGTSQDCNGNGRPDECEPDCDGDGTPDSCEGQPDCNNNNVPDDCDLTDATSTDCNGNNVPDECDLADTTSDDCNGNELPDECDIAGGTSDDCNGNNVLDSCELAPEPVLVVYDIPVSPPMTIPNTPTVGTRTFDVPDGGVIMDVDVDLDIDHTWNGDITCQVSHGGQTATLLNRVGQAGGSGYGYPDSGFTVVLDDEADTNIHVADAGGGRVTGTYQPDDYTQGPVPPGPLSVFDGMDKAGQWTIALSDYYTMGDVGTLNSWSLHVTTEGPPGAADCNDNGVLDECEPDCNGNGVPDDCDIAGGTSDDVNGDGVPDECENQGDGDCDGDGDVDLADFITFSGCFAGDGGPLPDGCRCADMDGDGDVDLADFTTFASRFTG